MFVTGYVTLLTRQVLCTEFSQCYSDVNICLWTDGTTLSQSDARQACQQRNNAFLVRVTDNSVQRKLSDFRSASGNLLGGSGFWQVCTSSYGAIRYCIGYSLSLSREKVHDQLNKLCS